MAPAVCAGFDALQAGELTTLANARGSEMLCNRTSLLIIHHMRAGSFICELHKLRLYMRVSRRRFMAGPSAWFPI
jgi:hypothetical protein